MKVFLSGVALYGNGLAGWDEALPVLTGAVPYVDTELPLPAAALLPPAERRRACPSIRLALQVGVAALQMGGLDADSIAEQATVFSSSSGNGDVIDAICEALATPGREVSPTRFHNSVHNAPAGYWSIAAQSRAPSTTLCAHDGSFAAGLFEASVQVIASEAPVLLVAYDLPFPGALGNARLIRKTFAVACWLTPQARATSIAALDLSLGAPFAATPLRDTGLEALRLDNPAARSLPLCAAAAAREAASLACEFGPRSLLIEVTPC